MISHRGKTFFSLLLFFIAGIFLSTNFQATAYALDNDSASEIQPATKMASLLDLELKDLMSIEVVSATRTSKSISETPENMEVITARDIELMGAHTVADVLNTVTGLQLDIRGGPGNPGAVYSQGVTGDRVSVYIDGILVNYLGDYSEFQSLPVQNIEKIEIIKGPASSSWGSALGGVINIITKSPRKTDGLNGTLSASAGERNTVDSRVDVNAKKSDFGLYLYAGRLQTNGMVRNTQFAGDYLQGKLSYDIDANNNILLNVFSNRSSRGEGASDELDFSDKRRLNHLYSNLSLNSSLSDDFKLTVSLWAAHQIDHITETTVSTGALTPYSRDNYDMKDGASAKLTWSHGIHNAVLGADLTDFSETLNTLLNGRQASYRQALYANDTMVIDKLSLVPGIREDFTGASFGNFTSPSLGATYKLTPSLLLRAFVERGFHAPTFYDRFGSSYVFDGNPDLKVEKVMSYQLGVETDIMEAVWLKVSAFRHDISNVVGYTEETTYPFNEQAVNQGQQRIQGVEAEFKTSPLYNTSLYGGAIFIDTLDMQTGQGLSAEPEFSFDIGLKYDDKKSFRALLHGRYDWFTNETPYPYADLQPKYDAVIFDLNLIKTLYTHKHGKAEGFFTAHNLFNGAQYQYEMWRNPRRWVEAGIRYNFW